MYQRLYNGSYNVNTMDRLEQATIAGTLIFNTLYYYCIFFYFYICYFSCSLVSPDVHNRNLNFNNYIQIESQQRPPAVPMNQSNPLFNTCQIDRN